MIDDSQITVRDKIFDVLAEFVNQISDDVLRENLENALERMMPEKEMEVYHD